MAVSRKKGVPEGYVAILQDMYNDCETLVSTRVGDTEDFHVSVGLHQGSAFMYTSPYTNHGCTTC